MRTIAMVLLLATAPSSCFAQSFKTNDAVTVIAKGAPLQNGSEVIARMAIGTNMRVDRIQEGWVRVIAERDISIQGWIDATYLRLRPQLGAQSRNEDHKDYSNIATVLGLELSIAPEHFGKRKYDAAKVIAEQKDEIAILRAATLSGNNKLADIAKDALEDYEWAAKYYKAIGQHPEAVGLSRDTTDSLKLGTSVEFERREIAPNESLRSLQLKLLHSVDEARAHGIRLSKIAKKPSSTKIVTGQALAIDYDESYPFEVKNDFDPFDSPHLLSVTNVSNATLTNCTLLVKVIGNSDTRYNLHFVPEWRSGQKLLSYYYRGLKIGDRWFASCTCPEVQEIVIDFWSDNVHQEGLSYKYDERERSFSFRDYCNRAKIVANCERYSGLLGSGYKLTLSFTGVPQIPAANVTFKLRRNGKWDDTKRAITKWREQDVESVTFGDINGKDIRPTDFDVIIDASHQKLSHSRHFTWKYDK